MSQKKAVINVSGMSCNHCVQSVEKALQQTNGVDAVKVDLASEKATVDYNPDQLNQEDLLQVIKDSGYGADVSG